MKKLLFIILISCITCNSSFAQSTQLKAQGMFFTAMEEYEGENYKSCITYLDKAIYLLGKTNSKIQYYKVLAYNKLGEDLKCSKEIKTYLNLNPPKDDYYKKVLIIYTKSEAKVEAAKARKLAAEKQRQEKALAAKRQKLKKNAELFEHKKFFALHKKLQDAILAKNKEEILILIKKGANLNLTFDSKANPYQIPNWKKGWFVKVNTNTPPPMYWNVCGDLNFMQFIFKNGGKLSMNYKWKSSFYSNWLSTIINQNKWTEDHINQSLRLFIRHGANTSLKHDNIYPIEDALMRKFETACIILLKNSAIFRYNLIKNDIDYKRKAIPALTAIDNGMYKLLNTLSTSHLGKYMIKIPRYSKVTLEQAPFAKKLINEWKNNIYTTPLCYAMLKGDQEAIKIICKKDLNFSDEWYSPQTSNGKYYVINAFQLAIILNDLQMVKFFAINDVKWNTGGDVSTKPIKSINGEYYFKDNLKLAKAFASKELYEFIKKLKKGTLDLSFDKSFAKAKSHYDSKQYNLASEELEKLLKLKPNDFEINYFLGCSYYNVKKYEEATKYLKNAIDIEPKSYDGNYKLGLSYYDLKKYEKASVYLKKSWSISPSSAELNHWIGLSYHNLKSYEKAYQYLKNAYDTKPDNYHHNHWFGIVNKDLKKYEEASIYFKNAINIKPNDFYSNYWLGMSYYNLKKHKKASIYVQKAVHCKPEDKYANYWTGKILVLNGKYDQARKYFKTCIELEKDGAKNLSTYAYAYLGNLEKCVSILKLKLNKENTKEQKKEIYSEFAETYSILKKDSKAIEYLQKALEAGYNNFNHISNEPNYDNIRNLNSFKTLLKKYQS